MKISRTTFIVCCLLTIEQKVQAGSSGYIIEWGRHNNFTGSAIPAALVLSNSIAVSAGRLQCLALKADGTVIAWSWNQMSEITFNTAVTSGGEFSDGKTTIKIPPEIWANGIVKIKGQVLSNVVSTAVGSEFGLALKRDGTVVNWGKNTVSNCPSNVIAIAAAGFSGVAVKEDGTVVEWLGAKAFPDYGLLKEVPGLSNVVAVSLCDSVQGVRNVALKNDGTVTNWGAAANSAASRSLSNVVAVATGGSHTLALKKDGTIFGWGWNSAGESTGLPSREAPYISSGEVILGGQILSNVVSIAANDGYSMALKNDGRIIVWGKMVNNLYPVYVPEGLTNVVMIAAGENFCLAITTNKLVADKFKKVD